MNPSPFPFADFERAKSVLKTALSELRETYALLTGETGTGKTALLRQLRSEVDRTSCRVLYFSEARRQKASGLVRVIAKQLRVKTSHYHAVSFDAVVKTIAEDETRILLWVDEAHDLPEETLFQIRALAESDLDAPTHLQVLLVGLPRLRVVLQSYPQLWRRIAVREEITGLLLDEVDDFLRHHFSAAHVARLCNDGRTLLFERARGVPGFLLPMFRAVLAAASATKGKVDPSVVDDALQRWDLP
jgi:type II secretory pathway predicted ATPase ExeA